MTSGFHDPTGTGVVSAETGAELRALVDTLDPDERDVIVLRFGLLDGLPRTVYEIADSLGMHSGWVRLTQDRALRRLRHPSRARTVRDNAGVDLAAGVLDRARVAFTDRSAPIVFCDRHGWVAHDGFVRVCVMCPCRAGGQSERGRPREFCSSACRQAAYRLRRKARRDDGDTVTR